MLPTRTAILLTVTAPATILCTQLLLGVTSAHKATLCVEYIIFAMLTALACLSSRVNVAFSYVIKLFFLSGIVCSRMPSLIMQ